MQWSPPRCPPRRRTSPAGPGGLGGGGRRGARGAAYSGFQSIGSSCGKQPDAQAFAAPRWPQLRRRGSAAVSSRFGLRGVCLPSRPTLRRWSGSRPAWYFATSRSAPDSTDASQSQVDLAGPGHERGARRVRGAVRHEQPGAAAPRPPLEVGSGSGLQVEGRAPWVLERLLVVWTSQPHETPCRPPKGLPT
jgi:hypothetical protein